MSRWKEHASSEDASVNWTRPTADGGMQECRYVRRVPEYFIAYLSSHSGCKHACRFCHLTQTAQTTFTESTVDELIEQLNVVYAHYDSLEAPAKTMNINFMARGEPLSSASLLSGFDEFATYAREQAEKRGIGHQINISTIFPVDAELIDLTAVFGRHPVTIYWSLYSLDERFRKRWLPRAQKPDDVMTRLLEWQNRADGKVALHWAVIDGENSSDDTAAEIAGFVLKSGLRARMNLVRYNPHSERTGREASDERYESVMRIMAPSLLVPGSRIVPRVGFDVKASCGMFMTQ